MCPLAYLCFLIHPLKGVHLLKSDVSEARHAGDISCPVFKRVQLSSAVEAR